MVMRRGPELKIDYNRISKFRLGNTRNRLLWILIVWIDANHPVLMKGNDCKSAIIFSCDGTWLDVNDRPDENLSFRSSFR